MPNYNVTFTTTFTSEVNANSPEEAIDAIQIVSNNEEGIDIDIVAIEEILPPVSQGYVSLREFHNSQTVQNQQQPTDGYVRFVNPSPRQASGGYIPLFRSSI